MGDPGLNSVDSLSLMEEKTGDFEGDFAAKEPKVKLEDGEKGVAKFLQYAKQRKSQNFGSIVYFSAFLQI